MTTSLILRLAAVAALMLVMAVPARAADVDVDLELILAVDVSWSMDLDEQALQRQGYINALRHADVLSALRSGLNGKIAVAYVEWGGPYNQNVVIPWTLIDGFDTASLFVAKLGSAPISRYRGTSISSGLLFSSPMFENNGFQGIRKVIDISGDGPNNMGLPAPAARDTVLADGITINGLPIMMKAYDGFYSIPDLDTYYEDCVIGGPGAFIVTVQTIETIADAIRRKLVLEIAGREPRAMFASDQTTSRRVDCLIGEKLFQRWMQ
jgi:hypothetical protein